MASGFGGGRAFNPSSPSGHAGSVAQVVRDYIPPGARVLDVGGTRHGFLQHAQLPAGVHFALVNTDPRENAEHGDLAQVPVAGPPFDLIMMFGMIMYVGRDKIEGFLSAAHQRLRQGGTLLIAEPDTQSVGGFADRYLKAPVLFLKGEKFTYYKSDEVRQMLANVGFTRVRNRSDMRPAFRQPPYYILAASF